MKELSQGSCNFCYAATLAQGHCLAGKSIGLQDIAFVHGSGAAVAVSTVDSSLVNPSLGVKLPWPRQRRG